MTTNVPSLSDPPAQAWASFLSCIKHLKIKQCGLSRHGHHTRETFLQNKCWSYHFYHYQGRIAWEDQQQHFSKYWSSLIPPGKEIEWSFPKDAYHYYAHFTCENAPLNRLPTLLNTSSARELIQAEFRYIVARHRSLPPAASIRFHDLLWRLAAPSQEIAQHEQLPSALQIVISIIRNQLDQPLYVSELAEQIDISTRHLNRLFTRHLQVSTQEYIQNARASESQRLLADSEVPIQSIAKMTGFDDLQAFNKFIRKHLGQSPRAYRASMNPIQTT